MTYELRFDAHRFTQLERTSQGFVKVRARLTRTGVLEYRRADGTVRRELRPADEVFAPESLASLAAAPVTDLHPTVMVSPKNVKSLRVGGVLEHRIDGAWIAATLQVEDADAIEAVLSKKRTENSLGYTCKCEEAPGRWDARTGEYGPHVQTGEPYDAIQRGIVYNHSALLPTGTARAGAGASIRLDGDGEAGDSRILQARADMLERREMLRYPNGRVDNQRGGSREEMLARRAKAWSPAR